MSSHHHDHPHSHGGSSHQQKKDCDNCEDGEGCKTNPNGPLTPIARGIAANLAKIDIFAAIETGDLPLVHYIATKSSPMSLRRVDVEGNTVLHLCAKKNHVDLAAYLVEMGIPVDISNTSGHTPLMIALSFGNIAVTSVLLKLGADPNRKDALGFSPIIHAAQFGSVFSFHHLISSAQVDINDLDNDKHSVLCWACYQGHKELVEYLVGEHCPQIPHLGTLDGMNRTPMHWAASADFPKVCALLVKHRCKLCASRSDGADDAAIEKNGVCPTGRQMLDIRDDEGKTPAELAKSKGHLETSQVLELERGGVAIKISEPVPGKVQAEAERLQEFLSSFLPFIIIIFIVMPYFNSWMVLLVGIATMGVHFSGRIRWTNKGRTWVPAGFLASSMVGMFWCVTMMNLSTSAMGFMLIGEAATYWLYYKLLFADPGRIYPSDTHFKRALDAAATGSELPKEYCRDCKIIKPPRSKHCRACGVCTDRFDHHCLWVSNCVAKKNHRTFYVMVFGCFFMMASYLYLSITFMSARLAAEVNGPFFSEGLPHLAHTYPQIFWMAAFFTLAVLPMGSLWVLHTSLIARDVTTYEMMTKFRNYPGGSAKPHSVGRVLSFLQASPSYYATTVEPPSSSGALNV